MLIFAVNVCQLIRLLLLLVVRKTILVVFSSIYLLGSVLCVFSVKNWSMVCARAFSTVNSIMAVLVLDARITLF